MTTQPSSQPQIDERVRVRRLLAIVAALTIIWIATPYLVRILFGSAAAPRAAALAMALWLVSVLEITRFHRDRLAKEMLSRIYLAAAVGFFAGVSATVLFLWIYG
jgi:hypothetical protein